MVGHCTAPLMFVVMAFMTVTLAMFVVAIVTVFFLVTKPK